MSPVSDLSPIVSLTFIGCILTVWGILIFAFSRTKSRLSTGVFLMFSTLMIAGVSTLCIQGYFQDFETRPPRLLLFVAPLILLSIALLVVKSSRNVLLRLPIASLTYIHLVRIPVEIVLWWLFLGGAAPEALTFEGANFDILSGITAPFAALFLIGKGKRNIWGILWNMLALGLLFNIVIRAILASPYFYNPEFFELPNQAVFYFPYILLPTFVVPAVFFCHLVSLTQLFTHRED